MIKFADLSIQYKQLKNEINNVIFYVIENSSFIGGDYLKLFEQNFSNFICNTLKANLFGFEWLIFGVNIIFFKPILM